MRDLGERTSESGPRRRTRSRTRSRTRTSETDPDLGGGPGVGPGPRRRTRRRSRTSEADLGGGPGGGPGPRRRTRTRSRTRSRTSAMDPLESWCTFSGLPALARKNHASDLVLPFRSLVAVMVRSLVGACKPENAHHDSLLSTSPSRPSKPFGPFRRAFGGSTVTLKTTFGGRSPPSLSTSRRGTAARGAAGSHASPPLPALAARLARRSGSPSPGATLARRTSRPAR